MPPPVHLQHQCEDINSSSVVRNTFLDISSYKQTTWPEPPCPGSRRRPDDAETLPDGSVKGVRLSMAPHRRCQKVVQYQKPLLPLIKLEQPLKQ